MNYKQFAIWASALVMILSGCKQSEFTHALPANSTALMSVDIGKASGVGSNALLKALLMVSNTDDGGIDLMQKAYLFETADGYLGLCAAVRDADHLVETFSAMSAKGRCKVLDKSGDAFVSVLGDAWAVAFNDDALLVAGPVAIAEQQQMQSRLVRYLAQDAERSGMASPMFQKLDSIDAPMALVAQVKALPEQMAIPFMLGAPRDADPSQVLVAAAMKAEKQCLLMTGHTFSFNKKTDAALQEAAQVFRPLQGSYLNTVSKDAALGLFVNVEGTRFLPLMHQNAGLQSLLTGINAAIDMDNIIKSVDGEMAITMPVLSDKKLSLTMVAQLAHSQWLADVGYWKDSCPKGGQILPWAPDGYSYQNGDDAFYFGVKGASASEDSKSPLQFYSGTTAELARAAIVEATQPMSATAQEHLKDARLGMVVNMGDFTSDEGLAGKLLPILKDVFGDVKTIVYKTTR